MEVLLNMWTFFLQLRQRLNSTTVPPSLSCHCISGPSLAHSEECGDQVLHDTSYYTAILLQFGQDFGSSLKHVTVFLEASAKTEKCNSLTFLVMSLAHSEECGDQVLHDTSYYAAILLQFGQDLGSFLKHVTVFLAATAKTEQCNSLTLLVLSLYIWPLSGSQWTAWWSSSRHLLHSYPVTRWTPFWTLQWRRSPP